MKFKKSGDGERDSLNFNSKQINKTNITRDLKKWLSQIKKWGYENKDLYVIEKYKDFIEFRFDGGIYEFLNYNQNHDLFSKFIEILREYNGEFYNSSIVRFYIFQNKRGEFVGSHSYNKSKPSSHIPIKEISIELKGGKNRMKEIEIEQINESEFNKNKGWGKTSWKKKELMGFVENLISKNKGKLVKIPTIQFYTTFRLDAGKEIVKYPTYNSVLAIRGIVEDLGLDKKVVCRTEGNVMDELTGNIKIDLRRV